ncbi:hypothetical protein ACLK1T_01130 [Escherichia coli]
MKKPAGCCSEQTMKTLSINKPFAMRCPVWARQSISSPRMVQPGAPGSPPARSAGVTDAPPTLLVCLIVGVRLAGIQ